MAQFYKDETLCDFRQTRAQVQKRYTEICEIWLRRRFKSERAAEFATHGFCRRLGTLHWAIEQVFTALPPDVTRPPEKQRRETATIALQSFVVNIFGCLDNLAWVWVLEKDVRKSNGAVLGPQQIGFGERHTDVHRSLPQEFRDYLASRRAWLDGLKGFRDSLAHRIPLYIPPFNVRPQDEEEYRRLEQASLDALSSQNYDEQERLERKQAKMTSFKPIMFHSISEGGPWIAFHGQMLVDFLTIDECSTHILRHMEG